MIFTNRNVYKGEGRVGITGTRSLQGGWICPWYGGVYPELHGYVWGVGYHRTWDTSPRPTDTDTWLVADARFPRGGGTRPRREGGGQQTILPNFPQNCMKLTEFGNPGARASLAFPLDPPLLVVATKTCTVGKRVLCILLECFLVTVCNEVAAR